MNPFPTGQKELYFPPFGCLQKQALVGPALTRELRSYPSSVPTLLDPSSDTSVVTFATLGYGQKMANNGPSGNRSVARFRKYFIIMQHVLKEGVLNV